MNDNKTITDNIITVLVKLDNESKEKDISATEFGKRGNAITNLLLQVENDFGIEYMLKIFIIACKKLGHTLGPLDTSVVKKLIENGFIVNKIDKVVSYEK